MRGASIWVMSDAERPGDLRQHPPPDAIAKPGVERHLVEHHVAPPLDLAVGLARPVGPRTRATGRSGYRAPAGDQAAPRARPATPYQADPRARSGCCGRPAAGR